MGGAPWKESPSPCLCLVLQSADLAPRPQQDGRYEVPLASECLCIKGWALTGTVWKGWRKPQGSSSGLSRYSWLLTQICKASQASGAPELTSASVYSQACPFWGEGGARDGAVQCSHPNRINRHAGVWGWGRHMWDSVSLSPSGVDPTVLSLPGSCALEGGQSAWSGWALASGSTIPWHWASAWVVLESWSDVSAATSKATGHQSAP